MGDEWSKDDPPLIPDQINFLKIVEWLAEERGDRVNPLQAHRTYEMLRAYDMLLRDLLDGDFEEGGRSQVRYLNPNLREEPRMTRAFLHKITRECTDRETVHLHLSWCWIPRRLFERWLENHRLEASPARFEPQEDAVVSDEERAIKALAAYLKQMPNCRRDDAGAWCRQRGHTFSDRSFQSQIWPEARKLAGLLGKASPGRKPKPK